MNGSELATLELLEQGTLVRARVAGEVDLSNAASLEASILALMPNEAVGMVLDLTGLSYLDSAGIRMLLTLVGRFSWRGQQLAIVAPEGSRVRRVLQLAGARGALVVDVPDDEAIEGLLRRDDAPPS
jgi:anti-anti-sigma factor